jgi:hypothetical protein
VRIAPETKEGPCVDIKGVGYLISIASVVLLGAVAWPKPGDPAWIRQALIAGMVASIVGMGLRYVAHRQQQAKLKRADLDAQR